MGIVRSGILAVVVLAAMGGRGALADQPALLTSDEVKKLVDSGHYTDALKALFRILDLKGAAAAPYDRHDMLMLRAECQLQTKLRADALTTLETAKKEAVEAANDDQVAQATALTLLIQQSPSLMYTPKTGKIRTPIPILDRILRKAAYDALFADSFAPLEIKAKAASTATSLVPIVEVARMVSGIRAVEKVSTGDNKQTKDITDDLTKRSLKLLGDTLDDMAARTQRISDTANRVVTDNVQVSDGAGHFYTQQQSHRMGLTAQDVQNLKAINADCDKIPPAAVELAQALGADAAPFKTVAAKADTVKDKAHTVLTDDYLSLVH